MTEAHTHHVRLVFFFFFIKGKLSCSESLDVR